MTVRDGVGLPPVGRSLVAFPQFGDGSWPADWVAEGDHGQPYSWRVIVHDLGRGQPVTVWLLGQQASFMVRLDTPLGVFEGLVNVVARTWPPDRTQLRGCGPLVYVGPSEVSDAPVCTGATVAWCPIHGNCSCPTVDGARATR